MLKPNLIRPRKFLNPLYVKKRISLDEYERFKDALKQMTESLNPHQDEEHNKKFIQTFLEDAYYRKTNLINTKGRTDLAIYDGTRSSSEIRVLVETKRPGNKTEMVTQGQLNAKALHELVLYYFRERFEHKNLNIQHLIITDGWEWFVIDATEFERVFGRSKELTSMFEKWNRKGQLVVSDTASFYGFVKDYLTNVKRQKAHLFDDDDEFLSFTYFNLKDPKYKTEAASRAIFKLLHPDGLLKKFNPNDANSLNRDFYAELLHIIGLKEAKVDKKKQIIRKEESERQPGALIENVLQSLDRHSRMKHASEQERFEKALELCMIWVNRILFLKLLESQLISYHKGDRSYKFLTSDKVNGYDELEHLFFDVLAKRNSDRQVEVQRQYGFIPYLNSSLFEQSKVEQELLFISSLRDLENIEYFGKTVLHGDDRKRRTGKTKALEYLFEFLDAYNFADDGSNEFSKSSKELINASVLGLVFEKINGYKEGSFYTPSFVTMYMARETMSRAVIDKFNTHYGWSCSSLDELHNKIEDIETANTLIDALTVCDPAVGSGHFLVSCLNEIIRIKSDLQILVDDKGKRHRDWQVEIVNDELVIRNDDGEIFEYHHPKRGGEMQQIQKMMFEQKRRIIEKSLFGVDINPNSVNICRLRLWIELLKHAYYTEESNFTELETLPNIDINIKCGNSLISRFPLDDTELDKKSKKLIEDYKESVWLYKEARDKATKERMEMKIGEITSQFKADLKEKDKKELKLKKLLNDYIRDFNFKGLDEKLIIGFASSINLGLYARGVSGKLFEAELSAKEKKQHETKRKAALKSITRMYEQILEIERAAVYDNAFEWRFAFPEVLDDDGNFVGFDAVIGNPPYIRQEEFKELKSYLKGHYETFASTADISVYFIEKGLQIIRPKGEFSFIVTNKWLRAGYGEPLRGFLKRVGIRELVDFGDLPVFEEATAYPCIVSLCKDCQNESFTVAKIDTLQFDNLYVHLESKTYPVEIDTLQVSGWSLADARGMELLNKLNSCGTPLGEYVNGNIYRGILTGRNDVFVIDEIKKNELIAWDSKSAEIIKPFLVGKDIKRYERPKHKKYLIFTRRGINIDEYPAIKNYLEIYRELLEPKPKDWESQEKNKNRKWKGRKPGSYKWYEIQDNIAYYKEFEKPKIVFSAIAKEASCTYDSDGIYSNDKTSIIPIDDLYLLAVINSSTVDWYLKQIASTKQNGYFEYKPMYVAELPIPQLLEEDKAPFVELAIEMLEAKEKDDILKVHELEIKINKSVYNLFGLSPDEIDIIEDV